MPFYAVKVGRNPGIYENWKECEDQVKSYSGSIYKKFDTKEEATSFIGDKSSKNTLPIEEEKVGEYSIKKDIQKTLNNNNLIICYVDGSFDQVNGIYGSGLVTILDGEVKKYLVCGDNKEFTNYRNVAGELIASIYALSCANSNKKKYLEIKYDYSGIEKWATGEWKANTPLTKEYKKCVKSYDINIKFTKIDAHTGIEGNEIADMLAKRSIKERKFKIERI